MWTKLNTRIVAVLTGTALAVVPMSMGNCDQALTSVVNQLLESTPNDTSYDDGWDDWSYDDESFGEPGELDGPSSPGGPEQPGQPGFGW